MSAVLKPDDCSLRLMQEADIPAVLTIERTAYDFPWSETIFSDCLRVGYCCWVLDTGSDLAGYGIMSVAAEESHVLNVCVSSAVRRRGFARMLMGHLLTVAETHGARIIYLEVRPTNAGAIKLYQSFGFSHVGTRRGYYPARFGREDALVLSRPLEPDEPG